MAVVKLDISKPGTKILVNQRRMTLMKKAAIPKVRIETGRAMSCKTGRIKVLTTPMTTAAITAAQRLVKTKPGTKYSTTNRAKTFIASLMTSFIYNYDILVTFICQYKVCFWKKDKSLATTLFHDGCK